MTQTSSGTEVSLFFSATTTVAGEDDAEEEPYLVVFLDNTKIGSTKPTTLSPNMSWSTAVPVVFRFEHLQVVTLQLLTRRTTGKDELIGSCVFPLGNLMSRPNRTLNQPLKPQHSFALESGAWHVKIQAEQVGMNVSGSLEFQLKARRLTRYPWLPFSRPNAFYVISRTLQSSTEVVTVYESETVAGNRNPTWRLVERRLSSLCNGNPDMMLDVSVYDKESSGKKVLLGNVSLSVNDLLRSLQVGGKKSFQLLRSPAKSRFMQREQRHAGTLSCTHARLKSNPTARALEYIAGGLFIDSVFAIDFTASNGDPRHPRSLHYRYGRGSGGKSKLNEYQRAILGVGKILMEYDSTQEFPCYGFGGSIEGKTSHCFALNGNPRRPACAGIDGVLAAYDDSFTFASLSGPTNFASIVKEAKRIASNIEVSQSYQQYIILVILTDGVITDFEETVEEIVAASQLPLSIVIVGVGDASFEEMEYLDGDTSQLTDLNGNKAKRDIVQFVPFSQCASDGRKLAEQTLAELPAQIVSYFESQNIVPNPPEESARLKTNSLSNIYNESKG